jgi:hypothetical protein
VEYLAVDIDYSVGIVVAHRAAAERMHCDELLARGPCRIEHQVAIQTRGWSLGESPQSNIDLAL